MKIAWVEGVWWHDFLLSCHTVCSDSRSDLLVTRASSSDDRQLPTRVVKRVHGISPNALATNAQFQPTTLLLHLPPASLPPPSRPHRLHNVPLPIHLLSPQDSRPLDTAARQRWRAGHPHSPRARTRQGNGGCSSRQLAHAAAQPDMHLGAVRVATGLLFLCLVSFV